MAEDPQKLPITVTASPKPTVGRIVRYVTGRIGQKKLDQHAAIVTNVRDDGLVDLTVFFVDRPETRYGVAQSEKPEVGRWQWPPRP